MKNINITILLLLALASCTAASKKVNDMTPAEIMAYNRTVGYSDRVHCTEEVRVGSHIRRQECISYRDLAEGRIGSLNTPSSSTSIAPPL